METATRPIADHDGAVAWAGAMADRLRERAAETERLRRLPPATIAEAEAAGWFALLVPTEAGGAGLGFRTLTETTRILATGCVSSAWTLSFLALHNWFVARAPADLQADVLAERPYALIPCPLAPTGRADPTEGGYRVTGRWQWATGVEHSDWVMVNALVDEGDGAIAPRFCLLPRGDVEVDDVWHTSGMRGTGSNDVVIDDVFVPAHLTIPGADFRSEDPPGRALSANPLLGYPVTPVLVLVAAAPAIGGAEAAVDAFRDRMRDRILPYSLGDRQAEQPAAQIRLAEARATVRAARLVWRDAVDLLVDTYDRGDRIDTADRGGFRLAAAHAVRLSLQAVAIVLEGSGASAHFEESPLQRIDRDLTTLKGHVVYDWDRAAQLAGKLELGIEPLPTDML